MRVIKYGKVYITRGGHLYRVVALTREAVTFESRGGWRETWPIERFLEAVEPEPMASTRVEPQPAPVPTNPNLFSAQGKAAGLLESYGEIAWEIEGLAQLAGGTDPDDDVCDALAQLAGAMKSLAAAREKALAEWAADGCAEPIVNSFAKSHLTSWHCAPPAVPEDDDIIVVNERHVEPEEKP